MICFSSFFRYSYDVQKCMFSSGNITEKIRVSKFNCKEEIVVDLYAGAQDFSVLFLIVLFLIVLFKYASW